MVGLGVFQLIWFAAQVVAGRGPLSGYLATLMLGGWLMFAGVSLRQFMRFVPGLANGLFLVVAWQIMAFALGALEQGDKMQFFGLFGAGLFALVLMTLTWLLQVEDQAPMEPSSHKGFFRLFVVGFHLLLLLGSAHLFFLVIPIFPDAVVALFNATSKEAVYVAGGSSLLLSAALLLGILLFMFRRMARRNPRWLKLTLLAAAISCSGGMVAFNLIHYQHQWGRSPFGLGSIWFLIVLFLPLLVTLKAVLSGAFPKEKVFGGW